MKLSDLGERRILQEIIPRYVHNSGDDCAIIGEVAGSVVVTTDPVPSPAASVLGQDDDLFWLGWLLVTINASDIAASGARPLSFVAALDLPADLPVTGLERLLEGIHASCSVNGLKYVGGNLREATKISAVGTAIGSSMSAPLTRTGAFAGDSLVVIGRAGRFWADSERLKLNKKLEKMDSPIFSPRSQSPHIWKANEVGLLRCAMDTSDGLSPSLVELCRLNQLGIDVDLQLIRNASDFLDVPIRAERLWMGWGDWTVVAAVEPSKLQSLTDLMNESGTLVTAIGQFVTGAEVRLLDGDRAMKMGRLESERFVKDSWFSAGISAYVDMLKNFPLP